LYCNDRAGREPVISVRVVQVSFESFRDGSRAPSKPAAASGSATDVIQAPKPEPRIMRYEFSDFEWTAIKPMLPNKMRGVRRVNDRRVLNGIFWQKAD
jgi:hypothetical protein